MRSSPADECTNRNCPSAEVASALACALWFGRDLRVSTMRHWMAWSRGTLRSSSHLCASNSPICCLRQAPARLHSPLPSFSPQTNVGFRAEKACIARAQRTKRPGWPNETANAVASAKASNFASPSLSLSPPLLSAARRSNQSANARTRTNGTCAGAARASVGRVRRAETAVDTSIGLGPLPSFQLSGAEFGRLPETAAHISDAHFIFLPLLDSATLPRLGRSSFCWDFVPSCCLTSFCFVSCCFVSVCFDSFSLASFCLASFCPGRSTLASPSASVSGSGSELRMRRRASKSHFSAPFGDADADDGKFGFTFDLSTA